MNKFSKKKDSKKGVAIITVLGICFVLLALGTVLMLNSYAHMGISQNYYYEAQTLNLAEAGIAKAIFELEKKARFNQIATFSTLNGTLGNGDFEVKIYNNIASENEKNQDGYFIPPHSLLIISTGIIKLDNGDTTMTKTVESLVNYQLIPYTVSSEGSVKMNIGQGESLAPGELYSPVDPDETCNAADLKSFTAVIGSIDGFKGNMHSNFSDLNKPTYRCTIDHSRYVNLEVQGGTLSSSGEVGTEAEDKIDNSGGVSVSNAPKKKFLDTDYGTLYNLAAQKYSFTSLDENVPGIADFLGEMKNDGGELKGKVKVLGIVNVWFDIEHVPLCGNCLPDGMHWESGTGTLVIDESRNFEWGGNLKLTGVNIRVDAPGGAGLFAEGNITANTIEITADSFTLVSNKNINLKNASLNITAPTDCSGVAAYAKSFTLTTKTDSVPPGGNRFKGIAYVTDGKIDITNQYSGSDNTFLLEGLVINSTTSEDPTPEEQEATGLRVKNIGGADFRMELKYNPYVANSIIDYTNGAVHLQPVYWKID